MPVRGMITGAALTALFAAPVVAQIPTTGRGGARTVTAAPKILVATPFVFNSTDSAAAVELGAELRDRLRRVAGSNFSVIEREQMNQALITWGYPADAILNHDVSRSFGQQMSARALMFTQMQPVATGRYTVTARLVGLRDDAGFVVQRTQLPGESLEDHAKAVAEEFKDPIRAYRDAKECHELLNNPEKRSDAVRAAEKALDRVDNYPLAEVCLAQIAINEGGPSERIIGHLQNAIEADPLSVPAWRLLAIQYEAQDDSANVILAFQEMLLIEPTNEALRETAIKLFNQYGHPEAAVEIADKGLEIDPFNPDLWDLKANAHAVADQMPQAVAALGQIYEIDSTAVDTAYFLKLSVFADAAGDSTVTLRWAQIGANRFPGNVTLASQLVTAYNAAGELDSAIVAANRLIGLSPEEAVNPALATAQKLSENRRVTEAFELIDFAATNGDDAARQNAAAILTSGALPLLQQPTDFEGAAEASRRAIELAGDGSPQVSRTANYILGFAAFLTVAGLDKEAEETKSCELAQRMDALLTESGGALQAGRETNAEAADEYLGYVEGYKPRVASMIAAYCGNGGSGR